MLEVRSEHDEWSMYSDQIGTVRKGYMHYEMTIHYFVLLFVCTPLSKDDNIYTTYCICILYAVNASP